MDTKKHTPAVEPKYSLAELTAYSNELFQCRPEVVAGAVRGKLQNEYTVEELRQLINKFLNRKVNG
ncbi:MAG TPA: hypothetical protein VHY08_15740 [Bacillota bacterium]|nr:hypothetical protein [Bacillota bacterium]